MATGPAQCRTEKERGANTMATQACHGNSTDKDRGEGSPPFKETGAPTQADDVLSLVIREPLTKFI